MPKNIRRITTDRRTKSGDHATAALLAELAVRGWSIEQLADAVGVGYRSMRNAFQNDFSSKQMRQKINATIGLPIFTEGI